MKTKQIIALALCIILSFLTTRTAFANSARKYWSGADSYGTVITDKECPVTVESELLTFNIPDFPKNYGDNADYEASVTARYTFYNPADYTVTAKLEFPFGRPPLYTTGADDVTKYDITINDREIEKTVRHTFKSANYGFELVKDISRIKDGYKENYFFTPDLPVTKYVYEVAEYDDEYGNINVAFDFPMASESRVLFKEMSHYVERGNICRMIRPAGRSDKTLTVYVFGQQLEAPPEWKFYKNRNCNDIEETDSSTVFISSETMTFEEFALTEYPNDPHILVNDWYNAVVDAMTISSIESRNCTINDYWLSNLKNFLLRWYEYEITLAPGERIVNTVTAPIYPDINEGMKPPVYKYTYLLSPAKTWADFGKLDIVIDTPFYLIDNIAFEKTDTGYRTSMDGLPDGELEFSLSTSKKPRQDNPGAVFGILLMLGALAVFVGVIVLIVMIIAGVTAALTHRRR